MDTLEHLFSPPYLGSHDTEELITILRISSVVTLVSGLLLGVVNSFAGVDHLGFSLFLLASVSIFSLWPIRSGKLMLPSFLLPLSALLVLTSNLIVGGSLQEPGVLVYSVVIIYASLLLGKRAALLFAGLSVCLQTVVFFAVSSGVVAEAVYVQESLSGLIIASLLIALTARFLWIMLDSLEHSVNRVSSSEACWRSLVENAPVTIVNTDTQGIVHFINRSANVSATEMIGKPILDFVHMKDYRRAIVTSRKVLKTGERGHYETLARYIENQERFYSVSIGPIIRAESEIEGLTFIVLDITEQKQSENEINRLNAELEQLVKERTAQLDVSNQELASFSYSISHNLRTPLRALDGFSLTLLEDYEAVLDDQGKDYLKRMPTASQRMDVLIDELLRLASITRRGFQSQTIDLSALVNSVANDFMFTYPDRSFELIVEPGLIVSGDENPLRTALDDLFRNAWKFTSQQDLARIEFGCQEIDGIPSYFVSDNGVGFDMQYAAKLFQPFQHLHGNSRLEESGMGLAIVQRIVQKHGGRIWAEAQVDHGATFYFTFSS